MCLSSDTKKKIYGGPSVSDSIFYFLEKRDWREFFYENNIIATGENHLKIVNLFALVIGHRQNW